MLRFLFASSRPRVFALKQSTAKHEKTRADLSEADPIMEYQRW